jgi:hypothetical protein
MEPSNILGANFYATGIAPAERSDSVHRSTHVLYHCSRAMEFGGLSTPACLLALPISGCEIVELPTSLSKPLVRVPAEAFLLGEDRRDA